MFKLPRHYRLPCALAAIISLGSSGPGATLQDHARIQPPRIEAHAGSVFAPRSGGREPGSLATYRVDAQVLLPLLLVSIPIASRSRVGFGHFYTRDRIKTDGTRLRAFEFFATSIPARARGLSRLGFLREAVQIDTDGTAWTAYFGVVSSTRPKTRTEAEETLGTAEDGQRFSVIDGMITPREATNEVSYFDLAGPWSDADQLYSEVRRRLADQPAARIREIPNGSGEAYGQPLAFLGGLQASLLAVARTIVAGGDPRKLQQRYIHDGRVLRFELTDSDVDTGRGKEYAAAGWASAATAVHRLEYRVLTSDGNRIEDFTLWVELPPAAQLSSGDPIIPIAFELKPRSFLRLRAVRVASKPAG